MQENARHGPERVIIMSIMTLDGAVLHVGQDRYTITSGLIRSIHPVSGEVQGSFVLPFEVKVALGLSRMWIEGSYTFEVKLLSTAVKPDGVRKYRFVAVCPQAGIAALDMMLSPVKYPTILENMMH
jgi:hypothetical protein